MSPHVNVRTKALRDLIEESLYVIDEVAVAEAIVVRAAARRVVPQLAFRSSARDVPVRSFRHDPRARSFRLSRVEHGSARR
jgi:hypothetical protein